MSAPEKEKRAYELPASVLQDMQAEAVKTDRSLSYLLQDVWQSFSDQIASVEDLDSGQPGDKTTQTVFGSAKMHAQIESKAKELGCTEGRLIEAAWKLSRK